MAVKKSLKIHEHVLKFLEQISVFHFKKEKIRGLRVRGTLKSFLPWIDNRLDTEYP